MRDKYLKNLIEPIYKFEKIMVSSQQIGPYLYRNTTNNTFIASWEKPNNKYNFLYKGEDIGFNTDAVIIN